MPNIERKETLLSTVVTVTGAWSLGHLLLLWALPRGDESALGAYGAGVLGGLAAGLVGAVLSRLVVGREDGAVIRRRALVAVGFLPPAAAGLTLLLASGDLQQTRTVGASNTEALAAAIGSGFGTAVASAALTIVGFVGGALLAILVAWFLWDQGAATLRRRQKVGLSVMWLAAITVGVTVFLYLPR